MQLLASSFSGSYIPVLHGMLTILKRVVFRGVRKIAKSDYELRRVCPFVHPSVRPNGTIRLPLDGFDKSCYFTVFRKYV